MRIALPDAYELTRALVAARPAASVESTSQGELGAAHVLLSSAVRASAAALTRALTERLGPEVREHLRYADQLVLTVAAELVVAHGIAPEALSDLALALARYRVAAAGASVVTSEPARPELRRAAAEVPDLATSAPVATLQGEHLPAAPGAPHATVLAPGTATLLDSDESGPSANTTASAARTSLLILVNGRAQNVPAQFGAAAVDEAAAAPLTLVRLTHEDERLARTILGSLAMRDTRVDRAFVHALVAPEVDASPAVDLALVHRLVVTLSPRHHDGASDPSIRFGLRDARIAIADALTALALPRGEVERLSPEIASLGTVLLRVRSGAPPLPAEGTAPRTWRVLAQLTRNDRALLSLLYGAQAARRGELTKVDDVLHATFTFRRAEETVRAAQPEGATDSHASAAQRLEKLPAPRLRAHAGDAVEDPGAAVQRAREPEPPSSSPRSYGSATQLAAQLAERYRRPSTASPAVEALRESPRASEESGPSAAPTRAHPAPAHTTPEARVWSGERPLDLARALGLQSTVETFHAQRLRARRFRARGKSAVRAIDELLGVEGEALEGAADAQGGGSRWRTLLRARRRRRRH